MIGGANGYGHPSLHKGVQNGRVQSPSPTLIEVSAGDHVGTGVPNGTLSLTHSSVGDGYIVQS